MFGLVRGLVEWVPTSAAWAGYVAGPLAVLGYLAGSIPFGDIVATRRFRRQLDHGRFPAPQWPDVDPAEVMTSVLAAATTLLIATIAWDVGQEAAPRGQISAVATYADQALGAWVSIAVWTGAAAVLGSVAPVGARFRRGGRGIGPALALLVVYVPLVAAAGVAVGSVAYGFGSRRNRVLVAACLSMVVVEYLLWITDTQLGWGITNGPETGLWTAVLAVVLLGRNVARQ